MGKSWPMLKLPIFAALFLAAGASAWAADGGKAPKAASVSATPAARSVPAGGIVDIEVTVTPSQGVHLYRDKISLKLEGAPGPTLGQYELPPGIKKREELSGEEVEYYQTPVVLRVPVTVPAGAPPGKLNFSLGVAFQGCTDNTCFAPESVSLPLEIEVAERAPEPPQDSRNPAPGTTSPGEAATAQPGADRGPRGWLLALLGAFVAGLAVSFTPCVYPMIPVTVALIGGASQGDDERGRRRRLVSGTLVYVTGIALTYAVLGTLAAAAGIGLSRAMQHPAVPALIGAFMGLLAMSMFGAFDLRLPAAVTSKLGRFQSAASLPLLLLSGAVLGLVASPCVSGPLAGLLAAITTSRDPVFGAASLFCFAWGMSALLIVAGIFPGLLTRPGAWMVRVKLAFGVVLGLAGLYFARTVLPERIFAVRPLLVLAASGTVLTLAALRMREESAPRRWLGAAGALILTASFYVGFGTAVATGGLVKLARATLPAAVAGRLRDGRESSMIDWQPFSLEKLSAAADAGRPVIVDFYADWCTYCHTLDAEVFSRREVAAELSRFTALRVDGTTVTEAVRQAGEKFGDVGGYPRIILLSPEGREIWRGGWPMTADGLLAKLREIR